jgi:hypothetical protein
MLKFALAGAFALATMGSSLAFADNGDTELGQHSRSMSGKVLTYGQIVRFKSVLKLTPEQQLLWPAVERAFNEMVKAQFRDEASSEGVIRRISNRAASMGTSALALQHLASAAYPLIRTLDDGQKQSAMALARSLGLESMAAAF